MGDTGKPSLWASMRKPDGGYARYSADRRNQLESADWRYWVFRHDPIGCDGRHADLDGLVLSPADKFWAVFYPPIDSECGCYVVGARSPAGVLRLGGNLKKLTPDWVLDQVHGPDQGG